MFPDPSQAPVELQTISVTAEVLTALVHLRNNNQVSHSPVQVQSVNILTIVPSLLVRARGWAR